MCWADFGHERSPCRQNHPRQLEYRLLLSLNFHVVERGRHKDKKYVRSHDENGGLHRDARHIVLDVWNRGCLVSVHRSSSHHLAHGNCDPGYGAHHSSGGRLLVIGWKCERCRRSCGNVVVAMKGSNGDSGSMSVVDVGYENGVAVMK